MLRNSASEAPILALKYRINSVFPIIFITLFRLYPKNDNAKSAVALTLPFISKYEPSFQRLTVPNGCSTILFRFLMVFSSGLKCTITKQSNIGRSQNSDYLYWEEAGSKTNL